MSSRRWHVVTGLGERWGSAVFDTLEDALVYWNLAKRAGLLLYVVELPAEPTEPAEPAEPTEPVEGEGDEE